MDWLIAGLCVGPVLYLVVTLAAPPAVTPDFYQFGDRKLNPTHILDSSIMYALQISAISLFATWGYQYGLAAIIVPLFWTLGYFLFSSIMSEEFLRKFSLDTNFRTLHGFLSDRNSSRTVCIVAAVLTLVGLSGPSMFEAFTTGRAVAAAVPNLGPGAEAGLAFAFLVTSAIYMLRGGFPGVVSLNQLQLAIGYGGFSLSFSISLWHFQELIGQGIVLWLSTLCFLCTFAIMSLKFWYFLQSRRYLSILLRESKNSSSALDILGWIACLGSCISFAAVMGGALFLPPDHGSLGLVTFITTNFSFGFTVLATVSLLIANILYQFVDVTQWQRLLSIAVDRRNVMQTVSILRNNILVGGICSGLTWVIAVAFGIFLRHLFPSTDTDIYNLLSSFIIKLLTQHGILMHVAIFSFTAALVAIMFSTLDSLVSATAFTVQSDILHQSKFSLKSLIGSRISTILVIIAQLFIYISISEYANDRTDAVLYVCYSFQLAMFPIVALLISGRAGQPMSRAVSMIIGCGAAIFPLAFGDPAHVYEFSPWLAVLAAGMVYMALGGMRLLGAKERSENI